MNVLTYNPDGMTKSTVIPLGRACECRATRIDFTVASWLTRFPGGSIVLYIKDPNGETYLAAVTVADGVASWVIRETDTTTPGFGSLELALVGVNGEKKLSAVATTKLDTSLVESEPDGDHAQPWLERAAEIQAETEDAARAAAVHSAGAYDSADAAAKARAAAEAAADAAEASEAVAVASATEAAASKEAAAASATEAARQAADAATAANEAYNRHLAANDAASEAARFAYEAGQSASKASISESNAAASAEAARAAAAEALAAPAINQEASAALVVIKDAAARHAVSLVSHIAPSASGVSAASVTRTGKNLLKLHPDSITRGGVALSVNDDGLFTANGTSTNTGTATAVLESVFLQPGTYTLSYAEVSGAVSNVQEAATLFYANVSGTFYRTRRNDASVTFTIREAQTVTFGFMLAANGAVFDAYTVSVQLEIGDAATAHETCTEQTLTAEFSETIYGGALDWNAGLLTVTHGSAGALAEPYSVQLDPQQLDMLKGENALWSDTGDTALIYTADTKLYIDNAMAAMVAAMLNV